MSDKRIIRVFPSRTSYTPDDEMAFIGMPPMIIPEHDEVHVSCTFSWDRKLCEELAAEWEWRTGTKVKLGGVAFGSPVDGFTQGLYIKKNIIFTSRGCNNNCPWCCVPRVEGKLVELPICEGNVIQDNNFLQTSKRHQEDVFDMLKGQHGIVFAGGLEADLLDDHFADLAGGIQRNIKELWLACDTDARIPYLQKACEKLYKRGFKRHKIHCYVLSYGKDRERDEARARAVYDAGAMPFVQLFRDFTDDKTRYDPDWEKWARMWKKPACIKAHCEKGTDYKDFDV